MFKVKLPKVDSGFTLFEVLIAILVATMFVSAALQMIVYQTVFKVAAERQAKATFWIQQDLEGVKSRGASLDYDTSTSKYIANTAACSATTYANGYAQRLTTDLNTNLPVPADQTFLGKTYQLNRTSADTTRTDTLNVLRINYAVVDASAPTDTTKQLATLYAEVIPDASFACP